MTDTTLNTTNPTPVDSATTLNGVIAAANGGATSEAVFGANIVDASPTTITGADLSIDGAGFTLTGSSTSPGLVVASNAEVFVGDLNINDGGDGSISVGVGGQVNFIGSSAPTGSTLGVIGGAISGAGAVVVGTSTDTTAALPLVFDAANTYTGATDIYQTLDLVSAGSIADSASVTLGAVGVLDISNAQTAGGAAVTEIVNNLSGAAGSIYLGLNTLEIVDSSSTTFSGVIANNAGGYGTSGQVQISAAGETLTLTGDDTYTGGTKILSGTLALTGTASIADSANVSLKATGATLDVSGETGPTVSINELTGVAGSKVVLGANTLDVTENVVSASFSGVISGSGGLTLSGPDELSLAGANTYMGATVIESGATLGVSGAGSLATSGISGAGAFDISAATAAVTVADLTTTGAVTLGAERLIVEGTSTSSGVISGSGSLQVGTASVTGSETLSGTDTYTGATVIYGALTLDGSIAHSSNVSLKMSGASLTIDSYQSIHELTGVAGTSVVNNDGLVVTESVTNASFSGVISGSGNLEVAAAASGTTYTLTLAGANTYTGGTAIDHGATLALSGAGSVGTGNVTDNGVLDISGASNAGSPAEVTINELNGSGSLILGANFALINDDADIFSGVISGSGGIEVSGFPGNLTLSGANTYTGATQIDSGAELTLGAALASSGITDNGSLYLGDGNDSSITVSQVISGTGELFVTGGDDGLSGDSPPFTATLTGADTYTGYTELYEYNTLVISGGGSIGDSSYVYNYGGTIDISGADGPIVLNNYYDDGSSTAQIVLGANTVIFEGTDDGDLYTTVISGTGAVQIGTSSVAAEVYIDSAQTYTGATKVYGYLELSDAGSVASSSNVSLKASGAVFDVSGVDEFSGPTDVVAINTLTGVAGSEVYLGSNTLDVTQNIAATFSGVIADGGDYGGSGGSLIVDGTATLTLAGDNTYTGGTTIDPGASLALSGAGTLGTGDVTDNGVLSISAATVTLDDFSGTGSLVLGANTTTTLDESNDTFSGVISGSGGIVVEGDLTLTSASTYTGATVIDFELTLGASLASSGITDNGYLVIGDGNESAITVSQVISGDGFVYVDNGSDGLNGDSPAFTATLTAANTYTGETYIGEYNTLALSGAGSIADSDYVANQGGTIDISHASGAVVLQDYYDGSDPTSSIVLGANTVILEGSYAEVYAGVISGSGAVQIGTATIDTDAYFETAQTYTGATTIYGDLQLDEAGSIASSSNVSLKASGAEFDISGITSLSGTPTADINTLTGVAGTYVELGSNNLDVTQNIAATFSGTIEGSGSLIVDGAATLTLAGTNTYSGTTTIDAGASLALSGTGTLGTGDVTDNGVLDISAATPPGALVPGSHATVTLNEFSGTGSLVLGSNAVVFSGDDQGTFSGAISGAGSVEVSGEIYLSGANTYTGSTTIDSDAYLKLDGSLASSNIVDDGHLLLGGGAGTSITISQVISGTGNVDVNNGDDGIDGDNPAFTATVTGADTYTGHTVVGEYNTLAISGGGSISDSSNVNNFGGTIDISGANAPVVLTNYNDAGYSTAQIVLGSNTVIFEGTNDGDVDGGVISGTGSVQVGTSSVAAYLEFGNAQAYTGATKVYGDLYLYDDGSVASSSNVSLKAAGATFDISGVSGTAHINTLTGVAMTTVDLGSNTLDVTQNTAASFSGVIEGSGNLIVDAAGAATLTLLGVNTLTGSVTDNGALTLGVANAIMDSSLVVDGTLNLGANQSVLSLTGSSAGTVNLGAYALTDAIASATQHDTLAGLITGSGSLVETGSFGGSASAPTAASNLTSSFLTLSHAGSTFTGGVTIEGGTVEVAALGAAGTGAVTFADVSTTTAADAGILQIDNAALTGAGTASESFSNTISGVSAQDIIDLSGLTFSTAPGGSGSSVAFHNGELLVTEGNVTVALTIAGLTASQAAEYHVYEDAHGGTFVTQVAPADATHFHP